MLLLKWQQVCYCKTMNMILPLRLIGYKPLLDSDPRFLDSSDVPFVIIAILCLCYAYYKTKTTKYDFNDKTLQSDSKEELKLQSYDVLMQPKKEYNNFITSNSKSFKPIPYKKIIITLFIIIFYYLIFTGKI